MPSHTPINPDVCTYIDFLLSAQGIVLPAMAATGNPNYTYGFNTFVNSMWNHYSNTNASWGGCHWFENRLYALHQGSGNPFTGWVAIRAAANPNSNQYIKLTAKIKWANTMHKHCGCHV